MSSSGSRISEEPFDMGFLLKMHNFWPRELRKKKNKTVKRCLEGLSDKGLQFSTLKIQQNFVFHFYLFILKFECNAFVTLQSVLMALCDYLQERASIWV